MPQHAVVAQQAFGQDALSHAGPKSYCELGSRITQVMHVPNSSEIAKATLRACGVASDHDARTYANERHSWGVVADKTTAVYARLLEGHSS